MQSKNKVDTEKRVAKNDSHELYSTMEPHAEMIWNEMNKGLKLVERIRDNATSLDEKSSLSAVLIAASFYMKTYYFQNIRFGLVGKDGKHYELDI